MPSRSWLAPSAVVVAASIAALSSACGGGGSASAASSSGAGGLEDVGEASLPVLHPPDPARAAAGWAHFSDGTFARALIPAPAIRGLYNVWGGLPPKDLDTYWQEFRARYGLHEAPYPNQGFPMGIHAVDADHVTFDCMLCHADVVAGKAMIGAANTRLDFQGLVDDLQKLADLAAQYGYPKFQNPVAGQGRTGAAGATDAMGLGFWLSKEYGPQNAALHTRMGFQKPQPWWRLRFKDRTYADGSGDVLGARTMAAMFLAFGLSYGELQKLDGPIEDIRNYALSIEAPAWPFAPPSKDAATRGKGVFDAHCASCHGRYGPGASYPDRVVDRAEVGTDPARAAALGETEAAWVNASWFGGAHPMKATGGYLAPPLVGVWASAPYFHDGSVPDLRAVLRSSERPAAWKRTGSSAADYDEKRVGLRFTPSVASPGNTIAERTTVDTSRPGMSSAGHLYGDELSDGDLDDLLAYLVLL